MLSSSHPILSCAEAGKLEASIFAGDEAQEWPAMQRAGRAIAAAVIEDFREIGGLPADGRVLVLVGKGHNGGDALIAAAAILTAFPGVRAEVLHVFGSRSLRPLAARASRDFHQAAGERAAEIPAEAARGPYDLCLDGVFGFQFRPPAEASLTALLERVNRLPIRFRAAVDLPSAGLFRADFTYATGCVKEPVLADDGRAGRVRYLDLGFFPVEMKGERRVLTRGILEPLGGLRPSGSDKRSQGHVLVLGGSRDYPGAVLMTVLAALRSGVGLVTAFVPESLAPAFAARAPEAMWVGWPETPAGGLALEGQHLLAKRLPRATAVVIGPGLGREAETLALVTDLARTVERPLLLDADALQPEIVKVRKSPLVITPHAGEFERVAGQGKSLEAFCRKGKAVVVLKGPVTRVGHGPTTYHSFFGGPVLARGGSGDLLAGLIGGLLAQTPQDPLLAACRGTVWHGCAADMLARAHGQTAVQTTQVLDFLPAALHCGFQIADGKLR